MSNIHSQLHKIDEKSQFVEVYHALSAAAEAYGLLSGNIPRVLLEVNQHIHGQFDRGLYYIFKASTNKEYEDKIKNLERAAEEIYYQYTSLEYLVKQKALTVGAANTVIDNLTTAYQQLNK